MALVLELSLVVALVQDPSESCALDVSERAECRSFVLSRITSSFCAKVRSSRSLLLQPSVCRKVDKPCTPPHMTGRRCSYQLLTPLTLISPSEIISNAPVNRTNEIEQLIAIPLWGCCCADPVPFSCFANMEIVCIIVVQQVPMQSLYCVLTNSYTVTTLLPYKAFIYNFELKL